MGSRLTSWFEGIIYRALVRALEAPLRYEQDEWGNSYRVGPSISDQIARLTRRLESYKNASDKTRQLIEHTLDASKQSEFHIGHIAQFLRERNGAHWGK